MTMQSQVAHFIDCSTSDLPQLAAKLGDTEQDLIIAALQAAHAHIDGVDEDSIKLRAQIRYALVAAGELGAG